MLPTTTRLKRRTARLARCFQVIAVAAGAAGVAVACGSHASGDGATGDAGDTSDASAPGDSTLAQEGGEASISDAGPARDAEAAIDVGCGAIIILDDASTDAEDICDYTLTCGLQKSYGLTHIGCTIVPADPYGNAIDANGFLDCSVREGLGCSDGSWIVADGGAVTFQCYGCFGGGGRRPPGLVSVSRAQRRGTTRAGAHFAEMARLEAASVHAFDRLATELADHRAPRRLVEAARESARDEERHAAAMGRLAQRFGAKASVARVRHVGRRSLAAIARENAVEGCVRETFGALVNTWQSMNARDERVRSVLGEIARDETRHAALAWEIAAWAESRVSMRERNAIDRARRRAVAALTSETARETPHDLRESAGLPDAQQLGQMLAELGAQLWAISPAHQRAQSTA